MTEGERRQPHRETHRPILAPATLLKRRLCNPSLLVVADPLRHCVTRAPEMPERLKNRVFLRPMEPQPCVWYYAREDGNTVMHTNIRRARRDFQRGAGPGPGVAPTRPAYLLPGPAGGNVR
jgi:hypothetical protein